MADIYSLQQAAGTVHRELSFDVDGRFATYEGVRAEEVNGVLHLVVVLSTKPADTTGEPVSVDETTPAEPADPEGGDQ